MCDDDAYLAEMKQKTAALKKDQDARMKKEIKGVKVEMERSKKLNEIVNPIIAEMNNLGGRKTRRRRRRSKKLTGRK